MNTCIDGLDLISKYEGGDISKLTPEQYYQAKMTYAYYCNADDLCNKMDYNQMMAFCKVPTGFL